MLTKQSIVFFLIIIAWIQGCGGTSADTKEGGYLFKTAPFPTRTTLPLSEKFNADESFMSNISTKSYNYESMQLTLLKQRSDARKVDFNRQLIQHILSDIDQFCTTLKVGESCTIPEDTISLDLSMEDRMAVKQAYPELNITVTTGTTLRLGEVTVSLLSEESFYRYGISVDMLKLFQTLFGDAYQAFYHENLTQSRYQLYWSADNQKIRSIFQTAAGESYSYRVIDYDIAQKHLYTYLNAYDSRFDCFYDKYLTFWEQGDVDHHYVYRLSDRSSYSPRGSFVKANLSDLSGYLLESSFDSRTVTFFDGNGATWGAYGCGSYDTCDFNDKSTWSRAGESEQNASTLDETHHTYAVYLEGEGGVLENGSYLLMPPNLNMDFFNHAKLVKNSIGEIVVDMEGISGVLYDIRYRDQLDQLELVHGLYDQVNSHGFEVIDAHAYPQFTK